MNDLLIEFNYRGNTAQLYSDGILIADDYFSGHEMPFALRRHRDKLSHSQFIFQITPLLPQYDIYFEENTELAFTRNMYAELKEISVIPEYAFKIKLYNK